MADKKNDDITRAYAQPCEADGVTYPAGKPVTLSPKRAEAAKLRLGVYQAPEAVAPVGGGAASSAADKSNDKTKTG